MYEQNEPRLDEADRRLYSVSPSYIEEFKQFIVDVLGGRTYSLGRYFWAFLWLPTVIINIFILAHRATYFAMNAEVADMLGDLLWAIQFAVFFVGYVGLVNCVRRQRRWG